MPIAAFTIRGVAALRLLKADTRKTAKARKLVRAGMAVVAFGLALTPVTPIIRRICASSFVLAGSSQQLFAPALACWLTDIIRGLSAPSFCEVIGMNPVFIYLATFVREGDRWGELPSRSF